jgi:Flp pilus assembly protein TadG
MTRQSPPCPAKAYPTKSFFRNQNGSATVEAVIWMPVFVFFLGLVVDTSLIFARQAQALRIIQDANRSLSIGRIMTVEDTESMIFARLTPYSPHVQITTSVDMGLITSTAVMPASDLTSLGLIPAFAGLNVSVTAQHMSEN